MGKCLQLQVRGFGILCKWVCYTRNGTRGTWLSATTHHTSQQLIVQRPTAQVLFFNVWLYFAHYHLSIFLLHTHFFHFTLFYNRSPIDILLPKIHLFLLFSPLQVFRLSFSTLGIFFCRVGCWILLAGSSYIFCKDVTSMCVISGFVQIAHRQSSQQLTCNLHLRLLTYLPYSWFKE